MAARVAALRGHLCSECVVRERCDRADPRQAQKPSKGCLTTRLTASEMLVPRNGNPHDGIP